MGSIFTKGKELNSSDLNGIAEHLKTCKNVIVMSQGFQQRQEYLILEVLNLVYIIV